MNRYQVMGLVGCCILLFLGVVKFLTLQGVPFTLALLGVYVVAVGVMLGMQRRARQAYDGMHFRAHQRGGDIQIEQSAPDGSLPLSLGRRRKHARF